MEQRTKLTKIRMAIEKDRMYEKKKKKKATTTTKRERDKRKLKVKMHIARLY